MFPVEVSILLNNGEEIFGNYPLPNVPKDLKEVKTWTRESLAEIEGWLDGQIGKDSYKINGITCPQVYNQSKERYYANFAYGVICLDNRVKRDERKQLYKEIKKALKDKDKFMLDLLLQET